MLLHSCLSQAEAYPDTSLSPEPCLRGVYGCREDVIGIIIVKELILVEKEAGVRVGDLKLHSAPQLKSDTRLYDMLRLFETGRCHLAVLVQAPGKPVVTGSSPAGSAYPLTHLCAIFALLCKVDMARIGCHLECGLYQRMLKCGYMHRTQNASEQGCGCVHWCSQSDQWQSGGAR